MKIPTISLSFNKSMDMSRPTRFAMGSVVRKVIRSALTSHRGFGVDSAYRGFCVPVGRMRPYGLPNNSVGGCLRLGDIFVFFNLFAISIIRIY